MSRGIPRFDWSQPEIFCERGGGGSISLTEFKYGDYTGILPHNKLFFTTDLLPDRTTICAPPAPLLPSLEFLSPKFREPDGRGGGMG